MAKRGTELQKGRVSYKMGQGVFAKGRRRCEKGDRVAKRGTELQKGGQSFKKGDGVAKRGTDLPKGGRT